MLRTFLLLVAICLFGACPCSPRVEAPQDFEELATWFWTNQREVSDEELQDGIENIIRHVGDLTSEERAVVGSLSRLGVENLEWTALDNDPTEVPGFFLASRFTCGFDTAQEIITAVNQEEIHPGVYESYGRDYEAERDDYLAGDIDLLLWETSYSAAPTPGGRYEAKTNSGVRFVPKAEGSDVGPSIVQGTFLAEPANFDDPESNRFDQDYQVEVFTKVGDEIYHFYGLWRYIKIGIFDVNDDVLLNFQYDAMIQWDGQTEDACATWPELP